jgi:formate dehydrogenase maturation protein FdhE
MSLATTPTRRLTACGSCGSHRTTSIAMTLTDGSPVDFLSCHACEAKRWTQGGVDLDIASVLGKAQKIKK